MELEALLGACKWHNHGHSRTENEKRRGIAKSGIIDFFRFWQSFLHVITTGKLLQRHEADRDRDSLHAACNISHENRRANSKEVTCCFAFWLLASNRILPKLEKRNETNQSHVAHSSICILITCQRIITAVMRSHQQQHKRPRLLRGGCNKRRRLTSPKQLPS